MARQIQSQVIPQKAVRPVAPVAPTGVADIGQLIQSIARTGTVAAQTQAIAFRQNRQLGAIERQANAAETQVQIALVDQERLESEIEEKRNRVLTLEAKDEVERLSRLESRGFGAVLAETPDDEKAAIFAEFPFVDPDNLDQYAKLIGSRLATADETNLLRVMGEAAQAGTELEASDVMLDLMDKRKQQGLVDPLAIAAYEQQFSSVVNSWRKNTELVKQKLQTQELANSAGEENNNSTYRALEEMFTGDLDAEGLKARIWEQFDVLSAALPSHDKTEHLDLFVSILDDWARSAPDLERSLAVVSELSNLGEQYQRRIRGLKDDLQDAVKRQAITRETTRVTSLVDVAQLKIVELGTEGSQSLGRLADLRKQIEGLNLPEVEVIKLLSRADKELAQLARSRGEQIQLDRILAGESSGMVSASATARWYKNHPEISIEGRLASLASKGQLLPRVAANDVEDLVIQAPGEFVQVGRSLEQVSRNATGALIAQMRVPGMARALLNSTRGFDDDDRVFKQITDGFAAPGAFKRYIDAVKQLGGTLPTMLDEEGNQIIFQIDDAKFPQNRLIERFLLSPDTQIDPSVLEDFNDSFIAGWIIAGDEVTFAGVHPRDQVEFARSYAVNAIERRYALVGQRDGTRQFVRRDLLGDPTDEEVLAISRRMALTLSDAELETGLQLSIAWGAIQPDGDTSMIPIGGIAITEDSEGPQFVSFSELDHATGLMRTVDAVTDPVEFDRVRLLMGDASKRLDPTVRLNWTPDKGPAVAGQNPEFLAVIGPDMIREGKKAWFELVGGRINVRSGEFGTFMDSFLATHKWSGAFPRPLLMQSVSSESLTGINLGAGVVGGATRRNVLLAGGAPDLRIGNQLANAPTPQQFDVEPGTDISLVPAAMREIMDLANGDPDQAAKMARDAGWLVPEIDD